MPVSFDMASIGEESLCQRIVDIAERVHVNLPRHNDPEKFHAEKSEIVRDLKRIAREVSGD